MKITVSIGMLFFALASQGQKIISVAENKTTGLVFRLPVISVDRGSASLLAQKANGAENIVLVKAASVNIAATNLTVITADGQLHSFIVQYAQNPQELVVKDDDIEVKTNSSLNTAARATNNILHARDESGEVAFALVGAYVNNDQLIFKFEIKNNSPINYDVEKLRIYTKDRKRNKRTAQQETEILPIGTLGEMHAIKAYAGDVWVIAVSKFTLSNAQQTEFELQEKSGGRHLRIILRNHDLRKTAIINE